MSKRVTDPNIRSIREWRLMLREQWNKLDEVTCNKIELMNIVGLIKDREYARAVTRLNEMINK